MTETETIGEKTFWKRTFSVAPINIIFNNGKSGDSNKTADITGLTHDSYFTYNGTSGYTDITDQYYTPEPTEMPACVKPIDGHLYVYFQANKDYDMPYIWVWGANEKNFCANTDWPGDKMKWVGTDSKNHQIWLWDKGETPETMPTSLLFSNKGTPKTADMKFQNGGYYDATGLIGVATQGIAPVTVSSQKTAPDYNLSGQRVDGNYRGIVIRNGRKVVIR